MMSWYYNNELFTGDIDNKYYGFIYEIENLENGKKYIGKKFFTRAAVKQVKGKKKRIRKESDWINYYGSSEILLKEIESVGKEKFKRSILRLCNTRGETNYWEVKYQFERNVLEALDENNEPLYYNGNIMMKFTRRNIGKNGST